MFDNVGKNLDEEATKRSFASVLITSLMLGAGAAFTLAYTTYKVVEEFKPELLDDAMVEIEISDEVDEEAPPPPPPPPPPAAAAEEEEEEEEDEEETKEPDDMVEEQKELEKEVDTKIKTQERPAGVKDGVEGGEKDGVKDGVKDGIKDGVVGGQLDGGLRVFHHSELDVKKRKLPVYPEAAESMNLGDQRCKVNVKIDEKGVPYGVTVADCPKVFHDEAKGAIMEWRWYPPKVGNQKVKAQTLIAVVFKAR